MLKSAANAIHKADLRGRVRIAQGDALSFDGDTTFGVRSFDRVYFSYTLSMIPPWRAVLPQALDAVAPGGRLHIVDFGQQEGWPGWFKSMLYTWLRQFSVHPRPELEAELQKLASDAGATLEFTRLYRGYAEYAVVTKAA